MILELELGQWAESNQKVSGGMEILKDYREAQFGWIVSGHAEQIQSFEKNSLSFCCVLYIILYLGLQRWWRYTHCPGVCLTHLNVRQVVSSMEVQTSSTQWKPNKHHISCFQHVITDVPLLLQPRGCYAPYACCSCWDGAVSKTTECLPSKSTYSS